MTDLDQIRIRFDCTTMGYHHPYPFTDLLVGDTVVGRYRPETHDRALGRWLPPTVYAAGDDPEVQALLDKWLAAKLAAYAAERIARREKIMTEVAAGKVRAAAAARLALGINGGEAGE